MGTYLRRDLSRDYFTIGQTFYEGVIKEGPASTVSFPPPPSVNASESLFHQADLGSLFINFRTVPPRSTLAKWLETPREVRSMAGVTDGRHDPGEIEVPLSVAYDGLTFIEVSHPPHFLKAQKSFALTLPARASGWMSKHDWVLESLLSDNANGGVELDSDDAPILYLTARPDQSHLFARIGTMIDAMPYRGSKLRLVASLATSQALEGAVFAVTILGNDATSPISKIRLPKGQIVGTTVWTPIDTTISIPSTATKLDLSIYLFGSGTVWAKGLSIASP
jgi:Erythromycin esterase